MNVSQNGLTQDYTQELNLLEEIEMRTSHLCSELRLNEDIHLSWVDLCCILSPSNPTRIADRIFRYYNSLPIHKDNVYQDIYNSLGRISEDDLEFWSCDVVWFQSIAEIIWKYFRDIWWYVVEEMERQHEMFPSMDIDFVFSEAILTMRKRDSDLDRLFSCDLDGKIKLNYLN